MEVATLIEILLELAPELAFQGWVNPTSRRDGFLIKRLGVCIDPTASVIASAVNRGINLLVAYHSWHGEAQPLIRDKELEIIPLHTAWDNAPEGVNLTFAREIGLTDIQIQQKLVTGRTDLTLRVLLERCRQSVDQNIIPYWGELNRMVKKVGIWAGPGFLPFHKQVWEECVAQGCDTIISGEISLMPMRYAAARQLQLVDLGHSQIAKPAMVKLVKILKARCGMGLTVEYLGECYGCNYYTNFNYSQIDESEEEFISLFTHRG